VTLPIGEPFWFVCGVDPANSQFFFKLNADATVYIPMGTNVSILQRPDATSSVYFMRRPVGNAGDPLNGYLARPEWHKAALPTVDMWTRWHLGAQRTFNCTISNPTDGASLGAIDVAAVTLTAEG